MEQNQYQVLSVTFLPSSFKQCVSIKDISLLSDSVVKITTHSDNLITEDERDESKTLVWLISLVRLFSCCSALLVRYPWQIRR